MNQKICKHCEDKHIVPGRQQVKELVETIHIPESLRVTDDVYEARLDQCNSCSDLREGVLCVWCGCFVQFRARPKSSYCPNPSGDRWEKG
ncbi:MAG: DUF6171 family protein [Treponema sp.]|nr:DUF6171 family protein [Treponema sp.]